MKFEGKYVRIWREDTILFVEYRPELVLTKPIAMEVLRNRLSFQKDQEYVIYCDSSGIIGADTEALDYLSRQGTLLIKAIAFYTTNPLDNLLTEFYLKTHKRMVPTKVFRHKFQALKFLKSYNR